MSVCQRGRACVWHSMSKWAAVRVPADYVRHRQRLKRVETDALSGSVESRAVVRRPTCGRRRWSFGGRLAWEFGREAFSGTGPAVCVKSADASATMQPQSRKQRPTRRTTRRAQCSPPADTVTHPQRPNSLRHKPRALSLQPLRRGEPLRAADLAALGRVRVLGRLQCGLDLR